MTLKPLFLFTLLFGAVPSYAGTGFTAEDLVVAGKFDDDTALTGQTRQLAAATDTLRAAFVLNPETAWTTLTPDERAALQAALGPDAIDKPVELAWLMRSASVRVGNLAAGPITALYHSVGDAWLLLGWARAAGEWRVINAALIPGSRLRSVDEAGDWTTASGSTLAALGAAHIGGLNRFVAMTDSSSADDLFIALAATQQEDSAAVYTRAGQWLGTLAGWKRDNERAKSYASLHASLVKGDASIGAAANLPTPVRASLTPVGAIAQGDGSALLMASPLFPELMVAANFDAAGTSFKTLSLVNLARAQGVDQ